MEGIYGKSNARRQKTRDFGVANNSGSWMHVQRDSGTRHPANPLLHEFFHGTQQGFITGIFPERLFPDFLSLFPRPLCP